MKTRYFSIFLAFALLVVNCQISIAQKQLYVLHSSDTHSRIDPIDAKQSTRNANMGGVARRAGFVNQFRQQHPNMLLFDCGDISQGTPYYNLYQGEVEIKSMNLMKYDAMTIGNHEFDFGLDNMARLFKMANFPIVCSNYDFEGTVLEGLVKPYIVVERNGIRVGIFGVCPQPKGLIVGQNYEGMRYTRPAKAAQPVIDKLRKQEKCDVVVCLSHLGWGDASDQDKGFIARISGIDVLLGGHSHTYFKEPAYVNDKKGHQVIVDHEGKNACFVGTIEMEVE